MLSAKFPHNIDFMIAAESKVPALENSNLTILKNLKDEAMELIESQENTFLSESYQSFPNFSYII